MKWFCLSTLLFSFWLLPAQEFTSVIRATNAFGAVDSVSIGYDPMATIDIDSSYGEYDITSVDFAGFEIRLAQIDIDLLECTYGITGIEQVALHQTKIDILPKECVEPIPGSTIGGFLPYSAILIRNSDLPIELSWDSTEFLNVCVNRSFLTDWPIDTHWDIPCPGVNIGQMSLLSASSIAIGAPTGIQVTSQFGDTLSMLYLILDSDKSSSTKIQMQNDLIIDLFPNPSKGVIHLKSSRSEEVISVDAVSQTGENVRFGSSGNNTWKCHVKVDSKLSHAAISSKLNKSSNSSIVL